MSWNKIQSVHELTFTQTVTSFCLSSSRTCPRPSSLAWAVGQERSGQGRGRDAHSLLALGLVPPWGPGCSLPQPGQGPHWSPKLCLLRYPDHCSPAPNPGYLGCLTVLNVKPSAIPGHGLGFAMTLSPGPWASRSLDGASFPTQLLMPLLLTSHRLRAIP